jgi:hypothetical protein
VQLLGEIEPAFAPEIYVDQGDMGAPTPPPCQRLCALAGDSKHLDALAFKEFRGGSGETGIVVDDDALQPLSS